LINSNINIVIDTNGNELVSSRNKDIEANGVVHKREALRQWDGYMSSSFGGWE
jgi:hypothetical protein